MAPVGTVHQLTSDDWLASLGGCELGAVTALLSSRRQRERDAMDVTFRGDDCVVRVGRYGNGRPALLLETPGGDSVAVATVNLPAVELGPNQVLVKDYSENAGVLAALAAAGVVRDTGGRVPAGMAQAAVCELLVAVPQASKERSMTTGPVRDRGPDR